jgi:hypothetical protein
LAYFNFNYVTDPPNDELVSVENDLNVNWQDVNEKIKGFQTQPNTIIAPPIGTEAYYPGLPTTDKGRVAVYNGADWIRSVNPNSGWTAWQAITLRSPVVLRPNFPPVAKINIYERRVVLSGGVLFGAAAPAWPTANSVEITSDTAFDTSVAPVNGGLSVQQTATGQITTAGGFSSSVVYAQLTGSRIAIRVQYQGDAGGGNFIMLDGITWWY